MNELKIWCEGGALMYWKTRETTALGAFYEFQDIAERIQLNTDNLRVTELELQDEDFNDIDRYDYKQRF